LFTWSPSAVSTDGSKSYNRRQSKPGAYKVCFGLVTSEPRVVDSVCVYVIAIKCQHVVLPAALWLCSDREFRWPLETLRK
jgi:hypothetical protein